jgi:outer membrane protein
MFIKLLKMKRLICIGALLFAIMLTGHVASAQNLKFGHINSDQLIQALPEFDSAQVSLEKFQKELINALDLMTVELNTKSEAYNKDSKNLSEVVRQTKEQELYDMNKRIQDFQNSAQTQLQNKQAELFQPILTKVEKAIKDVGKENGFIYVFDVAKGSIAYFDEAKSTDVMDLAKAKLGIKK